MPSKKNTNRGRQHQPHPQQRDFIPSGSRMAPDLVNAFIEHENRDQLQDELDHLSANDASSRRSRSRSNSPYTRSPSRPIGGGSPSRAKRSRSRRSTSRASHRDGDAAESDVGEEAPAVRTASADDWDNVRDGSIARRPAWRRPSPRWVLPFIFGMTLTVGMTAPLRQELYLDLACLAHPPTMPSSAYSAVVSAAGPGRISAPEVQPLPEPIPVSPVLSPADKWFRDALRDTYRYTHPKPIDAGNGTTPLPIPGDKGEKHKGGNKEGGDGNNAPHPFPGVDPSICKGDDIVMGQTAKLGMLIVMTTGILSVMTTGHWAGLSDRIGRRNILSIVQLGLLISEAWFLFIVSHPYLITHGYHVMLVGPILEGLLGGLSTMPATMQAYISDVTADGSRATAFSRLHGCLMAGFALGPLIGSLIVKFSGNILMPFYVTCCCHALICIGLRFLLPESLSSEARTMLSKRAIAAKKAARERDDAERQWEHDGDDSDYDSDEQPVQSSFSRISGTPAKSRRVRRTVGSTRRLFRSIFSFLSPLSVFIPTECPDGSKDYNLLCMGLTMLCFSLMMGIIGLKFVYAQRVWKWSTEQMGPYMSMMSIIRLVTLLGVLPLVMYYIKPYYTEPVIVEAQSDDPAASSFSAIGATERTPLIAGRDRSVSPNPNSPPKPKRTARLDYHLVRVCIGIEAVCMLILGSNYIESQALFLVASGMVCFGAPASPAASSLALSFIPHKREAGRLFGGQAVLFALGSTVLSPLLFANAFAITVKIYPPTIFLLGTGIMLLAQVAMHFVRLPRAEDVETRGRSTGIRGERERE